MTAKTKTAKTEPKKAEKKVAPALPAQKINRHWNDDGSLTVYANGLKLRRFGGEENEECSEAELEDTEGFAERWLSRQYKKATGGWVWGRETSGHNWHTKKQKAERLRAEAAALTQGAAQ